MTTVKEMMLTNGYAEVTTGGGCMAWEKTLADGYYVWITDASGVGLGDVVNEEYLMGVYTADGEHWRHGTAGSLDAALVVTRKWEEDPAAFI